MWTASAKAVDYRLLRKVDRCLQPGVPSAWHRSPSSSPLRGPASSLGCATRPALHAITKVLVAAERAFARHAEDADVRTAFLAAFADDGIWMTPTPMRLRDAYAARPAPADPRAVRLEWAPVISGICRVRRFRIHQRPDDTGRCATAAVTPQYGAYFSVWKRDAQQRWRVVLDGGIPSTITDSARDDAAVAGRPAEAFPSSARRAWRH